MNSNTYGIPFIPGRISRHDTSKDLDIYIVRVRYKDQKRIKLLIQWVNKHTGQFVWIGDKLTDNIEIRAEDYKYWKVLKTEDIYARK